MTTYTTWQLANMADCGSPDRGSEHDDGPSAGAQFLHSIADHFAELDAWDDGDEHTIADAAVPIYTHEVWSTFIDLQAYQEDPTELGATADDMEQAAKVCLYMIAERLANALHEDAESGDDDDDDTEDETRMTLHTLTADDLRDAASALARTINRLGPLYGDDAKRVARLRAAAEALDAAHAGDRVRCPICTTPLDPDTWSAEGFEPACRHGIAHTERCADCHEDAAEAAALAETEGTNR